MRRSRTRGSSLSSFVDSTGASSPVEHHGDSAEVPDASADNGTASERSLSQCKSVEGCLSMLVSQTGTDTSSSIQNAMETAAQVDAGIAAALGIHILNGSEAGECAQSVEEAYNESDAYALLASLRCHLCLDNNVPIIAMALIERCILAIGGSAVITSSNWREFLVTAIVVALKLVMDEAFNATRLRHRLQHLFDTSELSRLEMEMCLILNFRLTVEPNLFFEYYYQLRQLGAHRLSGVKDTESAVALTTAS